MQGRPVAVHCRSAGWSPAFYWGTDRLSGESPRSGCPDSACTAPAHTPSCSRSGSRAALGKRGYGHTAPDLRMTRKVELDRTPFGKGLDRPGQPHSGQLRDDTHNALLGAVHTNKDMLIIREWK